MIIAWVLYSLLVGLLLAAAAHGLEVLSGLAGRPLRWVWAGGLALTLTLVLLAPLRVPDLTPGDPTISDIQVIDPSAAPEAISIWERSFAALETSRRALELRLGEGIAAAERAVPPAFGGGLIALWWAMSAALLLAFGAAYMRVRRAMRRWPVAELHGRRVRLSPEAGPAVVGFPRAEIVVPRWLLSLSPREQQLVLAHEQEHQRAGDHVLLAAACAGVVLLPWHPVAWWMLARLRLAVELDCDARVLRGGASSRAYGTLLIDLSGRPSGFRFAVPALGDHSSHLERRLLAMRTQRTRFWTLRGGMMGALALVFTFVACEAKLPTTAQIDDMDVAAAEDGARQLQLLNAADQEAAYTLDAVPITAEEARSLGSEQIARIEVVRSATTGELAQVHIFTHAGIVGEAARARESSSEPSMNGLVPAAGFAGIIFIDEVRADAAAMHALAPADIERVEVIKGAAAARLFTEPEAARGVIRITTKRGGAPR